MQHMHCFCCSLRAPSDVHATAAQARACSALPMRPCKLFAHTCGAFVIFSTRGLSSTSPPTFTSDFRKQLPATTLEQHGASSSNYG